MKKMAFLSLCLLLLFTAAALAGTDVTLQEGIRQYQQENYEEAIVILTQVRAQEPESSQAAFFLGMAYKQTMDYKNAAIHLQDAVRLRPPIKEALVELTDTLYQLNRLDEAKQCVALAEKAAIAPARTAFLKGLILAKENNNPEAIKAFEKARELEPGLGQAAEFQIGVCYMKERKLDKAKAILQAAITRDPLSDLSTYARQYVNLVEEQQYLTRPLRLTVGVMAGYDTNLVSQPLEAAVAADITDEKGNFLSSTVRLDYIPQLEGNWLFNAQYSLASTVNSKHTHSHDSLANSFSISPGYNFGRYALNLNASYTNVLLRNDPDLVPDPDSSPGYKHYLDYISVGPALKFFATPNSIVEIFAGYDVKNYFNQKITTPDAVRDNAGLRQYLSWIWLFKPESFLNLRYEFTRENADGIQWSNEGHRLTANVSLPVLPEEQAKRHGPVTLQLTGSAFFQNFDNLINYGIVTETRRDKVYAGSIGLAWQFWKYASLIAQYTRTQNDSNVAIFEYNRNQYAGGFEFRY